MDLADIVFAILVLIVIAVPAAWIVFVGPEPAAPETPLVIASDAVLR